MLARLRISTIAIVFLCFDHVVGEDLWCYECNTDLRDGHKGDCNDPYPPRASSSLTLCPQNESHHCIKSIVLYRNVLVTVRGCVPSREIDGYCRHEEYFPQSSIECLFCKDYACNGQGSLDPYASVLAIVLAVALKNITSLF